MKYIKKWWSGVVLIGVPYGALWLAFPEIAAPLTASAIICIGVGMIGVGIAGIIRKSQE